MVWRHLKYGPERRSVPMLSSKGKHIPSSFCLVYFFININNCAEVSQKQMRFSPKSWRSTTMSEGQNSVWRCCGQLMETQLCGGGKKKDCQSLMSFLNLLIVHSSTQENSNHSSVSSLRCGFCHSAPTPQNPYLSARGGHMPAGKAAGSGLTRHPCRELLPRTSVGSNTTLPGAAATI